MSSLMGMNRYFADEGLKGLGESSRLQTTRENTKTQLEAAHDATVKSTTASMAGSGAMLGYAAAPTIAGMMAPAASTTAAAATTTAVAGGTTATAATTGTEVGSTLGPVGAVAGLAIGALAGWLFSEYS
jgi:hypothetical protein